MENARISHYELRRLLGRGGMGEVYEAFDLKARRLVALKFIAPELAADPDSFRRFEAEAHNAAALHHPHIATLFEFEPEGDRPFIAMELVAGPSLRDRLRSGAMPPAVALGVARDVATALAYAHRRNIVHRDIKPENLMFDEEGRIKVMDFGLARALLATRMTMTGTTLGTPTYMSPEAIAGTTGPPADVFALGLTLHEMLTGEQTFRGDSPLSVMFAIANTDAPLLRTRMPDLPQEIEDLVSGMLARDPAQRTDAATAARELARITGTPLPAPESSVRPAGTVSAATADADTVAVTTGAAGLRGAATGLRGAATAIDEASDTIAVAVGEVAAVAGKPPAGRKARLPLLPVAIAFVSSGIILASLVWMNRGRFTGGTNAVKRQAAVFLNNRAFAALDSGDVPRAHSLASEATKRDPSFGEAWFNLGAIYEKKGQVDSAVAMYRRVVDRHAKEPRLVAMAHYNLGDIDLRAGAVEQALDHLQRSFAIDSTGPRAYNNLGLALIEAHRAREALAILERGVARFPSVAPLHKNAGYAAMELQDDVAALRHLDQAVAIDPGLIPAYGLRARVRARAGDRASALADWNLYVAGNPPDAERAGIERALVERGIFGDTPP